MPTLSHINDQGQPTMVDVSEKAITTRTAVAQGTVQFPADVFAQLSQDGFLTKKGAVLQTAIIAGVMAAKKTSDLIPLCHPLALSSCTIDIVPVSSENCLQVTCTVRCEGKTGVEMEALTGVSGASLTIYDMCKALTQDITISQIGLLKKTGGKSDINRN